VAGLGRKNSSTDSLIRPFEFARGGIIKFVAAATMRLRGAWRPILIAVVAARAVVGKICRGAGELARGADRV
jgi:hypothetical protein